MAIVASHRTVTERAFFASRPNACAWSNSAPEYPPYSGVSVTTWTAYLCPRIVLWSSAAAVSLCWMKVFVVPPPK